ncbi:MAG: response regulator [Pseudomonadota bacterium]|nr:response regulator [Pseudomonadota bacterium]
MRILLVEDDRQLADGLKRALRLSGLAVDWLADGARADQVLRTEPYDLVVLDLALPGLDGLAVLKRLRRRKSLAPVLIITARGALEQRIAGLDLGADDYLVKPFALGELEARVRALLRRSQGRASDRLVHGPLVLDATARQVTVDGELLELPRRELCLLEILLTRAGQVVSKEQIAGQLFCFDDEVGPNAIELYVHRLRKKLEPAGVCIRTIRGLGYLLEKPCGQGASAPGGGP